ncbi:LytR C-terminal domain-containing protein [Candidatus Kaiserbacteria bacterium]|nr:LytR C-terminal domain-containing protein [Candidatus Kaiserbacteria bacterium]
MTANPAQEWDSSIRVINSNPQELEVYIDIVNFAPQGEVGQGVFIPVSEDESQGKTLAEWIKPQMTSVVIPPEKTVEIPFGIAVPEDAPPGGHFAAILIGTKPPKEQAGSSQVETSQVVTSLVFLRVTGDIIENGSIREFRATKSLVEKPEVDFELRFQNEGNVHILPQGDIKIYNMWGQERGVIPVNQQALFGNVLPNQIRKYTFAWTGEWSMADMGRYTAEVTLGYGTDQRQFATSRTYFWVLPWKLTLLVFAIIFGFILLITWAIRLYIEKMLSMAGVSPSGRPIFAQPDKLKRPKKVSVIAPLEEGILDLSQRFQSSRSVSQKVSNSFKFIKQYHKFFFIVLAVLSFVAFIIWFTKNATVSDRGYEVIVDPEGSNIRISSEQVEYDDMKETDIKDIETLPKPNDLPLIKLVNRSGVSGLAAKLRVSLESKGYEISDLSTDFGVKDQNTVIVYHPDFIDQALNLSAEIEGVLLSAYADAPLNEPITIYVGKDYVSEVE